MCQIGLRIPELLRGLAASHSSFKAALFLSSWEPTLDKSGYNRCSGCVHVWQRYLHFLQMSTGLLVVVWLAAHLSALTWLYQALLKSSPFNVLLIGAGGAFLVFQGVRYHPKSSWPLEPGLVLRPAPVLLMLGSGLAAAALRWLVDVEQLTVLLFALGTYGLCGLLLAPDPWRKGLPAAILVACLLPFSVQFSSGLGFPVRVLTARAVEQLLSAWQIAALSSHDIIVLENGIAHVDLPCSGLKSLWTGSLFLLATTWLESRRVGWRWGLVWVANLGFLALANTARVLLLVLLTHVFKQPQIAEVLHVPLGLLGFVGACALSWALLQTVPRHGRPPQPPELGGGKMATPPESQLPRPASPRAQAILLACVVALALLGSPLHPAQSGPAALAGFDWPQTLVAERLPLSAAEQQLFKSEPNVASQKLRFVRGDISGSMLVVLSRGWHAHHPPELCFVGNGLKVDSMTRIQLASAISARWLSLQAGQLAATYWFQSSQRTTDDFLARFWDSAIRREQTWVLVSILFDHAYRADSPEIGAFVTTVHSVIDHRLNGVQG